MSISVISFSEKNIMFLFFSFKQNGYDGVLGTISSRSEGKNLIFVSIGDVLWQQFLYLLLLCTSVQARPVAAW